MSTITSRGIQSEQAAIIAQLISNLLKNPGSKALIKETRGRVDELCSAFPLYKNGDRV